MLKLFFKTLSGNAKPAPSILCHSCPHHLSKDYAFLTDLLTHPTNVSMNKALGLSPASIHPSGECLSWTPSLHPYPKHVLLWPPNAAEHWSSVRAYPGEQFYPKISIYFLLMMQKVIMQFMSILGYRVEIISFFSPINSLMNVLFGVSTGFGADHKVRPCSFSHPPLPKSLFQAQKRLI